MKALALNRTLGAVSLFLASILAVSCAHIGAVDPSARGEARLAEMLEDKTAGKPQSCIPAMLNSRLTVIDETAIVYDAGSTI